MFITKIDFARNYFVRNSAFLQKIGELSFMLPVKIMQDVWKKPNQYN